MIYLWEGKRSVVANAVEGNLRPSPRTNLETPRMNRRQDDSLILFGIMLWKNFVFERISVFYYNFLFTPEEEPS
jgi:hypothetical protein